MQEHEQRVSIVVNLTLQYKEESIEPYLEGTIYSLLSHLWAGGGEEGGSFGPMFTKRN